MVICNRSKFISPFQMLLEIVMFEPLRFFKCYKVETRSASRNISRFSSKFAALEVCQDKTQDIGHHFGLRGSLD